MYTSPDLGGHAIATATAGTSGSFTVRLSPGTYYLAATSPGFGFVGPGTGPGPCRADGPAVVTSGDTVHTDVICSMK